MHGFLAEIAEKGIHNARGLIDGNPADMTWVNDNGPVDLIVGNTPLQQKIYRSAIASLDAANRHLKAYPGFLRVGGKYQIPNDQYQALKFLGGLSHEEAYKSLSATTSPTIGEWRKVNALLGRSNVSLEDLEPAKIDYAQAQKGAVEKTFEGERKSLLKKDRKRRDAAHERSKPSVREGAKATLVSAGIEGAAAKDVCDGRELASFEAYAAQQAHLEASLQERYARRIELLNEDMASFLGLLADAFVPDACVALEGSIERARHLGVVDAEILKDVSEIDNYFLA